MKLCETKNYHIEDLGIIEDDVYDIEVEDCHNFFANNILVHNSNYMDFSKIKEKYHFDLDGLNNFVHEKVEPYLEHCFLEMQQYMNHYQPVIAMKRECIADKAVFLSKKKRYALRVLDNEGLRYEHPHLKITGLEVIKSSTPAGVKDGLKGILNYVLENDRPGLIQYINKQRELFMKLPIDDIAIPRSITKYDAYTEEGIEERQKLQAATGTIRKIAIPIHNRAANMYNELIDKYKLNKEYMKIKSGDKIKMLFLTPDNPTGSNVIAYLDRFPKEFGLEQYIDKNMIFEKMFIDCVKNITDDFYWNLVQTYIVDDLFD